MSKMYKLILLAIMIVSTVSFAQTGGIKGKVTSESGEALLGINTIVEGTLLGAASNIDGQYEIKDIPAGNHNMIVTGIGFKKQVIALNVVNNRTVEVDIIMVSTDIKLSEVIVAANIAKNRETPVAFTDVSEESIKKGFTVQDVPHLFANTPGVYITSDGGSGMGDSKVTIRGFDEQRISVMINNVPVNDPESKKVYWSNWGSLPAASQSIQVQRGVGSSLYGSGALGGSINVITKDAPAAESLDLSATLGQYGIMKYGVDYNTGLIDNKFAFIGRFNYLTGNGWRQNTYYEGMNYYLSGMYFPNEKNTFKIILHGAPQYHAYSYYGFSAKNFAKYGRDWNGHPHIAESEISGSNYSNRSTKLMDVLFMGIDPGKGFKDQKGGVVIGNDRASFDNNVYHKPQFEVHHTYKFNDISKLTTTFFVSKGYGYGENIDSYYKINRNANGLMTWDDIYNSGQFQYRSYSDHFQTGILSSFQTKMFGAHDLTFGVEARYWDARHAGEILNTFAKDDMSYYIGAQRHNFKEGDLYYDYNTTKPQLTSFAHALWRFGKFSIMTDIQFSYLKYNVVEDIPSNNNYPLMVDGIPVDRRDKGNGTWTGTATDDSGAPIEYSLWDYDRTFDYISPKIGLNYNVNENLNVFANWSRAVNEPRVKYFFGYGSPNDNLDLETTSDIELGLGYRGELGPVFFDAKYNFYNIDFEGKALRIQDPTKANKPGYDYKGRRYVPIGESTYRGHELALNFDLPYGFTLGINGSIADNLWGEPQDSEGAQYLYSKDKVVAGVDYTDTDTDGKWDVGEKALHKDFVDKFGEKVEVGMPQTIVGATLGFNYEGFFANAALRFYKDLYVLENNAEVIVEGHFEGEEWIADKESSVLPSATVVDMILGYSTNAIGLPLRASVHVNNLLDEEYWQKGDSYGFLPGAERTIIFTLQATVF